MTYQPPTGPEFRGLMDRWGLSNADVARLLAVHPRTVQRWTGGEVQIPFMALGCLTGMVLEQRIWPDTWREHLGITPPD